MTVRYIVVVADIVEPEVLILLYYSTSSKFWELAIKIVIAFN